MKKVKVTLYRITKRSESGNPREWEAIYEGEGISMGDIIRQANAKGICCHDLDYCKSHPEPEDYEDTDWNYDFDLDNLDLEGLYISWFPCAHSDNCITGANLKRAYFFLERPKTLSLIKCDLRGAVVNWEDDFYYLDLSHSLMDEKTSIEEPETCLVQSTLTGTLLEKNGIYMPVDERIIYMHEVHSEALEEKILEYNGKLVQSITPECNLIVVQSLNELPEEIQKAKERGVGIMEFDRIKWFYYIHE